MTGNEKIQTFNATLTFNLPAVVTQEFENALCALANGYLGWLPVIGPAIGATCKAFNQITLSDVLNAIPNSTVVFNDVLAAGINVDQFLHKGLDVSAVQVTNSHWTVENGRCVLNCTIQTTSDPITASALMEIILGVGLLIVAAAIPVFFAVPGVGWIILLALAGAGLALIGASVVEIIGSSTGNLAATGLIIVAAIVGAVVVIPAVTGALKGRGPRKRKSRKR